MRLNTIYNGDCLVESEKIKSGSVDLILTDLPYGTMNGFNGIDWDFAIDPKEVYAIANRILRKNGKMVLFSQEPYTTRLITGAIPNVPFSYRAIWEKDSFGNALLSNKALVGYYEDILIFSKRHETEINHPIRQWLKTILENSKVTWSDERITDIYLKHRIASSKESAKTIAKHKLDWTYKQLEPINKKHYMALSSIIKFDRDYNEIEKMYKEYISKYPATFNLWDGGKHKSNILRYKKDYDGYHPTQKPVLLLEDLIKTFSNEGDLVVDLTMGSGSTGVACKNTGRNFIGIELDEGYFKIAKDRIKNHKPQCDSVVAGKMKLNTIYNEDCLDGMKRIPDKSVDMILCDLPYAETGNRWDFPIDPVALWCEYERIIKEDGAIVLTGTFKFGVQLYNQAPHLYKYDWVWQKDNGTNAPNTSYQPFRVHEQVFVFGKGRVTNGKRTPMKYNPQKTDGEPYSIKSGRMSENWKGGLKNVVTNNTDGKRHPITVQKINRDKDKLHPTQKPVALFEYLIKTYTNEGDVVLDNCMGSGTTAIACLNSGRNYIGFELDKDYYNIAQDRIKNHEQQLTLEVRP